MNKARLPPARTPWVALGFGMGLGIGLVGVACFIFVGSFVAWVVGGYSVREVLTSTSPDSRYRVVVSTRNTFPANEILDPKLLVRISLIDIQSGKQVDGVELILMEESDLGEPSAEWFADAVQISNIERWHNVTAVLRADTWLAKENQ